MPILVNLFNLVFDSGIIPKTWTSGIIKPIYKNRGSSTDPANYRPISLLSCMGKLFTAVLNARLQKYIDDFEIMEPCQAGFRKGFATIDNIFVLHNLIDIIGKGNKQLFCAFVDLKQAFDKVWHSGLWQKLQLYQINGKCLRVIQSMYNNIKSCILANGKTSSFFISNIGVRQGENLSPILFNLYLNDLERFLSENNIQGVECTQHSLDESIFIYIKLFALLYADDTVILSDSAEDLQNALFAYDDYCRRWKMHVNYDKTKILIFSKGKEAKYTFTLQDTPIEVVNEFKYLGLLLCKNNSFVPTIKYIADQGSKAVYSLLKKARTLQLPIDLQIELFNKLVKPILLYGCEIWGAGNTEVIERVQLKFLKQILHLKKCTPNYIVYGETGVFPLKIDIQSRMISYWAKLKENSTVKPTLATIIYDITNSYFKNYVITRRSKYFQWINCIKHVLNDTGFSGVWNTQTFFNRIWLTKAIKQKLSDVFIGEWYQCVENDNNYKLFKASFGFENYLTKLPSKSLYHLIKFRTRNHKLPIETGRWRKISLSNRTCNLCKQDIGDEFHYLLSCRELKALRKQYIKPRFYLRPNIMKYGQLLNSKNLKQLILLSKFIKDIFEIIG